MLVFGSCGNKVFTVCLLGARFLRLRPEKKDTVVCLAGCAVVLCQFLVLAGNWQFFVTAGNFYYDRKKKIQSSVRVTNATHTLQLIETMSNEQRIIKSTIIVE